jgi:hypothetical protein
MSKYLIILLCLILQSQAMCKRTIVRSDQRKSASIEKVIEIQKKLPLDRQLAALLRYRPQSDTEIIQRAEQLVSICCSIVAEEDPTRAFTQIALNRVSFDLQQCCRQTSNSRVLNELQNFLKQLKTINS